MPQDIRIDIGISLDKMEVLLSELWVKLVEADGEVAPMRSAQITLQGLYNFAKEIPIFTRDNLESPIFALLLSLNDIEHQRNIPWLRNKTEGVGNRTYDNTPKLIMEAYAIAHVDHLIKCGLSVAEAADFVQATLQRIGFSGKNVGKVKTWRNEISRIPSDHIAKSVLEAIRAESEAFEIVSPDDARKRTRQNLEQQFRMVGRYALD